jgi:hypothetical protein
MIREDISRWIGSEMIPRARRNISCVLKFGCGIWNPSGFYTSFVQGAAKNIIPKEFLEFPDSIFFHKFIFPYPAAD